MGVVSRQKALTAKCYLISRLLTEGLMGVQEIRI
jgi:hypothetical protein